jgi:hypothetical protein
MFSDKTDIRWRRDPLKLIVYKALRTPASTVPVLRCFERLFLALLPIDRPFFLLNSLERWILGGYIYRGYRQGLKEFGPINPDW